MIDQVNSSPGSSPIIFLFLLGKMFVNNLYHRNYYSRFFAELQARVALTVTLGVSAIDLRFSWEKN